VLEVDWVSELLSFERQYGPV